MGGKSLKALVKSNLSTILLYPPIVYGSIPLVWALALWMFVGCLWHVILIIVATKKPHVVYTVVINAYDYTDSFLLSKLWEKEKDVSYY